MDERGLLRDGFRLRTPMMARDGLRDVQRSVAQDAVARRFGLRDGSDLHAPGPRYCTDAAGLERKARAYAEMCDELQSAWKTNNMNDREVARLHDTGDPVRDAYLDYVADLTSAWSRKR
jgi:hypothetical protein